jgi:acylphosphatase
MATALRLRIAGRVQGVGYRAWLEREARSRGLRGWVRNRRDGSVEALAQGSPAALDALTMWARHGPPAARVADVDSSPGTEEAPERFEIRPTA